MTVLILEGGGARASFSMGVIDVLLENRVMVKGCYGASAGALAAINYLSGQRARSLSRVISKKDISKSKDKSLPMDMYSFILDYENSLEELDYEMVKDIRIDFRAVVSQPKTGQALYLDPKKADSLSSFYKYIAASCALPIISKPVTIDYESYYDGGFTDAIPIFEAMKKYGKFIIVLTRPLDFRREAQVLSEEDKEELFLYPEMIRAIENRHIRYNDSKDVINYLIREGKAVVIAPEEELKIDLLDFDYNKTLKIYSQGVEAGKGKLEDLRRLVGYA